MISIRLTVSRRTVIILSASSDCNFCRLGSKNLRGSMLLNKNDYDVTKAVLYAKCRIVSGSLLAPYFP